MTALARTLAAALALALFIAALAATGWAAEHAPTWLALVVVPAVGVVFWRLYRGGES